MNVVKDFCEVGEALCPSKSYKKPSKQSVGDLLTNTYPISQKSMNMVSVNLNRVLQTSAKCFK